MIIKMSPLLWGSVENSAIDEGGNFSWFKYSKGEFFATLSTSSLLLVIRTAYGEQRSMSNNSWNRVCVCASCHYCVEKLNLLCTSFQAAEEASRKLWVWTTTPKIIAKRKEGQGKGAFPITNSNWGLKRNKTYTMEECQCRSSSLSQMIYHLINNRRLATRLSQLTHHFLIDSIYQSIIRQHVGKGEYIHWESIFCHELKPPDLKNNFVRCLRLFGASEGSRISQSFSVDTEQLWKGEFLEKLVGKNPWI